MITQFQGESRQDAIANHFSLDIIGEESFVDFVEHMGYTIDADDEIIESLHKAWLERQ